MEFLTNASKNSGTTPKISSLLKSWATKWCARGVSEFFSQSEAQKLIPRSNKNTKMAAAAKPFNLMPWKALLKIERK